MTLHVDFETRSAADLRKLGVYQYATHPSTDIWCMGWAFDDEPVEVLLLGEPLPERIRGHVESGGLVMAHNAAFEANIWAHVCAKKYGWPIVPFEQWRCTMAMAYAMALPGSLERAAAAVGLRTQKDAEGRALMMRMCRPVNAKEVAAGGKPKWVTDQKGFTFLGQKRSPEWAVKRLAQYCAQDVEVERELGARLRPLSAFEQKVWTIDQKINQRGVRLERKALEGALEIRDHTVADLNQKMEGVTGGAVAKCSNVGALKDWAADYGVLPDGLAKAELAEVLDEETLPDIVRAALELRREAGRATSVAKIDLAAKRQAPDERVRDLFQYHGATTGRWAGRAFQPHNTPRDLPKPGEVEEILTYIRARDWESIDLLHGPPLTVISRLIRGFIVAGKGRKLIGGDWSNVEGRGLAWLAGEDWKLDAFRKFDAGEGPDLYKIAYGKSFGVDPETIDDDDERRQMGKVQELALGYQGGVGAFQTMASTVGLEVSDVRAEQIKVAWRAAHPAIQDFWYELQAAAIAAVRNPGQVTRAGAGGRLAFRKAGSFLWLRLPNGRCLCYPYPRIDVGDYGPFLSYKTVPDPVKWGAYKQRLDAGELDEYRGQIVHDSKNSREWCRMATYGGKLAENATQAICRDILAEKIVMCEDAGYPVVLHVHDEIVVEGKFTEQDREAVESILLLNPEWASGFPLAAKCWLAERYQK